jgi:hypothetical protein
MIATPQAALALATDGDIETGFKPADERDAVSNAVPSRRASLDRTASLMLKGEIKISDVTEEYPYLVEIAPDRADRKLIIKELGIIDMDGNGVIDFHELLKLSISYGEKTRAAERAEHEKREAELERSLAELSKEQAQTTAKSQRKLIGGLSAVLVLLIGTTFASSITSAHLSKDTGIEGDTLMVYGTDTIVKVLPTGKELLVYAPANPIPTVPTEDESEYGMLGCLSEEQAKVLTSDTFFTPVVVNSPDGMHSVQAHDVVPLEDGGSVITDTSGIKYFIKKSSACESVIDHHGRRLQTKGIILSCWPKNFDNMCYA